MIVVPALSAEQRTAHWWGRGKRRRAVRMPGHAGDEVRDGEPAAHSGTTGWKDESAAPPPSRTRERAAPGRRKPAGARRGRRWRAAAGLRCGPRQPEPTNPNRPDHDSGEEDPPNGGEEMSEAWFQGSLPSRSCRRASSCPGRSSAQAPSAAEGATDRDLAERVERAEIDEDNVDDVGTEALRHRGDGEVLGQLLVERLGRDPQRGDRGSQAAKPADTATSNQRSPVVREDSPTMGEAFRSTAMTDDDEQRLDREHGSAARIPARG